MLNQVYKKINLLFLFILLTCSTFQSVQAQDSIPNILLIITDDLGVDVTNGYLDSDLMPTTPTLDSLMAVGLTFDNVWANPKCTPTRGAIMSGKYGVKTGVTNTPGNLSTDHTSIFKAVANETQNTYTDALIGKWHLSTGNNQGLDPVNDHEADYFVGTLGSGVSDYYLWEKSFDGVTTFEDSYVTTSFTDSSIAWIDRQSSDNPWFLWLAHVAPHSPLHVPPTGTYSINATGTNLRKYIAMIEAVDFELNRLLQSMTAEERDNTLIIYIGDNGTPGTVIRHHAGNHGKSTLYQGGVHVPMIVAGKGVSRQGEREAALIHAVDIYATILEATGTDLEGGIYNSLSFNPLLSTENAAKRAYNYAELGETWTIRNETYKYIHIDDSTAEFYNLSIDTFEQNQLLDTDLTAEESDIKADLLAEAAQIRSDWSCKDYIKNGDEEGIDCGGTFCEPCATTPIHTVLENDDKVLLYPNPTSNLLNIRSETQTIKSIQVFDSFGRIVLTEQISNKRQHQLRVDQLASQIYMLSVELDNGDRQLIKWLKL